MKDAAGNFQERRRATLVGEGAVLLWGSLALLIVGGAILAASDMLTKSPVD